MKRAWPAACKTIAVSRLPYSLKDSALQKVASEIPVSRPLRPEPGQARQTGVRRDKFESLLDNTQPAETAPRSDRPERPRSTDRGGETRRSDDRQRTEVRRARDNDRASAPADRNQTKPTASSSTRQAKDGPTPSSTEAAATETKPEEAATKEFLTLAEGAVVVADGEEPAKTEETKADSETTDTAEGTDGANGEAKGETKADVATPVATVLPTVTQAETAPVTVDADAEIALAKVGGDAPAVPADEAAPDIGADAAPQKAAPETPKQADASPQKIKPTEKAEKLAEVAANSGEKPQQKADATAAAPNTETTKPGAHAAAHHGMKPPRQDESGLQRPDGIEPRDAKAPPASQKGPEHAASAQTAPADARADAASSLSSPPPAAASGINAVTAVPLHINAPSALPTLSSLTALRVDTPAEKGVPIAGLAVEIVAKATEGSKRFEIRLDPAELGRIDVRLDVDQTGKVTSRLVVDRQETLDLLRRDAHQLERALANAGLDTGGGLEFSLRDQNSANRDQQQREGGNRSHLIVPEDETIAAEAARRGYGRMIGLGGGVDIRI